MTSTGCEPFFLATIDGPPPLAPLYGLLPAAGAPAAGVRIVPDGDAEGVERWINGAKVWPWPPDTGDTWAPYATGSAGGEKRFGDEDDVRQPEFEAFVAYLPVTCKVWKVPDQNEFKQRALQVFEAVESSIVAREFMGGARLDSNPCLSDGKGLFPNGDTATSVANAISILENTISRTGRQGVIHVTPGLTAVASEKFLLDNRSGVIRTINGTVVIADMGYVGVPGPNGHTSPSATEEWIYATGPVDIRRSGTFVLPEKVEQALDRAVPDAASASGSRTNTLTYRVERYYLVDWDTQLQAAVLVDRCRTTC